MALNGAIRFARYAFMPNKLGYCGGNDNRTLFQYCAAEQADPGLVTILQKFQAAYPYLKLISSCNNIRDPFDSRVVEAYWVGNELLERVDMAQFYNSLHERFGKQLKPGVLGHLLGKPPLGARPHHNFHVFDVHSRTGALENSLDTMENCRISWGRVKAVVPAGLLVEYQPLVMSEGKLKLGSAAEKRIMRQVNGDAFVKECHAGDLVSFHWGWACEVLTPAQAQNLEKSTRFHLRLANQTL